MIETIKKILKKLIVNPEKYYTYIDCEDNRVVGCELEFINGTAMYRIWINPDEVQLRVANVAETSFGKIRKNVGRHCVTIKINSDKDKFEILNLVCQLRDSCGDVTSTQFKAFIND